MDGIEDCLRQHGVTGTVKTNGYHYEVEYNGLMIDFCAQADYNGRGRFVGCMYRRSLSPLQKKTIKAKMSQQAIEIGDLQAWLQMVKQYDYRSVHLWGCLEDLVNELLATANMCTEEYIARSIRESQLFSKTLGQANEET